MRKNWILAMLFIALVLMGANAPLIAHAQENEREDEGGDDDFPIQPQPMVTPAPVVQPAPIVQSAPVQTPPPVEPVPAPQQAPIGKSTAKIQKIQYIERLITNTVVPPIVVHDANENGIDDEVERLFTK